MRVTVYALAAIMLSAWAANSGQGAIRSGVHGPRSMIDKKTAAAIGLAHPRSPKSGPTHSAPPRSTSISAKTENVQKKEPGKRETAWKEASINGRSLSELGLRPPAVPRPGPALNLRQAELQRIQAETQRLGGFPYTKPSPLPPAQPLQLGPPRNGTLTGTAGNLQQRSPRTLTPLGGVAAGGNIGALNGTSFLPRRK
jgi:hypothetical protein